MVLEVKMIWEKKMKTGMASKVINELGKQHRIEDYNKEEKRVVKSDNMSFKREL